MAEACLGFHNKFEHDQVFSLFLQVVALCNELVGRVPCGGRQDVRANLRPISLSTPAGRLDWDPVGEVCGLSITAGPDNGLSCCTSVSISFRMTLVTCNLP